MLRDRRSSLTLALIGFVAAQVLSWAGWLCSVDNGLLSLAFHQRGTRPPAPRVTIVALDPLDVYSEPGAPESSPAVTYAALVERLHAGGAQVIALDVPMASLLATRGAGSPGTQRLAEAIRNAGNVVLPCVLEPPGIATGRTHPQVPTRFSLGKGTLLVPAELVDGVLLAPASSLTQHAAGLGHVNLYPDVDGVIRTLPLVTSAHGRLWPALALEVVRVQLGLPPGAAEVGAGKARLGDTRLAVTRAGEMFINFSGGYKHYPCLDAREVLETGTEALGEAVNGKVVLIGPTSHTGYWRTPIHPVMPGVELTANAVGNLLQNTWLRRPARWLPALLSLLLAIVLGLACPQGRAAYAALVSGSLVAGVLVVALLLFMSGFWFPAGNAVATLVIGGLVLIVRSASYADRARERAEARLDSRLDAIAGIGALIVSTIDRQRLLDEVVHWVERELDVPAVSILLLDERRRKLVFEVASGEKGRQVQAFSLEVGEGVAGTVASTGQALIVDRAAADPRHQRFISDAVDFPVESILCVPIALHGEVIGVIEALNKRSGPFTSQDTDLLTVIAQQAALFLETARLYSELQRRVDEATSGLRQANRDITSQKARLETLLAELESGVIYTDNRDRVVTWNRTVERLLGVRAEQAIGQPVLALIGHPGLSDLLARPLSLMGGRAAEELEMSMDGHTVFLRASVNTVAEEDGFGKLVLLTDITRLKELDRMKTDFVSFVSHELQNPLASIRGFAHLLQQKTEADSPNARLIRFLNQQATRMQWLVEDFLDISRIDSGVPLSIQVREIEDVQSMIQQVFELYAVTTQDHEFVVEIAEDLPPFEADRRKLEQVLVNLVGNAVKYSPDGGEVKVTVERGGDDVLFSVLDEGIGISEEDVEHLFQRFRRAPGTRERVRGTGIGLFLCRYLVEAQGGRIYAEPREKGSAFRFTIPLRPVDGSDDNGRPATGSAQAG
ncbi:MAG: CHASE2 domain-containing protein [Acidobacteriota bacterium]|nr:CHASE2 domain-containing protein [Acidobacteriota bacterium]